MFLSDPIERIAEIGDQAHGPTGSDRPGTGHYGSMRQLWCLLCSAIVLLAACGGDDRTPDSQTTPSAESQASSTPEASPSPSELPVPPEMCEGQQEIVSDPAARIGGELSGDVTGDGVEDIVSIASGTGDADCSTFVVVEAGSEVLSVPLAQEGSAPSNGFPRVNTLVQIDSEPGLEIVVDVLAGASTSFTAVFGFGTGTLARYEIEGRDPYADMFPTGGSVGHLEATDCMGAARVVISLAVPGGDGYDLRRNFYAVAEGRFTKDGVEKIALDDQQDLEAYQEFIATPFGTCPA